MTKTKKRKHKEEPLPRPSKRGTKNTGFLENGGPTWPFGKGTGESQPWGKMDTGKKKREGTDPTSERKTEQGTLLASKISGTNLGGPLSKTQEPRSLVGGGKEKGGWIVSGVMGATGRAGTGRYK